MTVTRDLVIPRATHVRPLGAVAALVFVVACSGNGDAAPPPSAAVATPGASTANATPADTPAPQTAPASPSSPRPTAAALGGTTITALGGNTTTTPGEPRPAPELADLVNAHGTPFDLADYRGGNTLLFFGYTHCPDVCPQTIGEIFGVFKALPETRAVFVSVDPERDTPEFLAAWTQYLPDQFDAVTGSPGAIRRAADNYGVKYARVETTSTAGYTMSHTADVYLIDGDGQLQTTYPFGTPAADIVADLNELAAG